MEAFWYLTIARQSAIVPSISPEPQERCVWIGGRAVAAGVFRRAGANR